jgi:hypothetical protein
MIKYIAIVGLLLGGSVLFMNQDKILSKAPAEGTTVGAVASAQKLLSDGMCQVYSNGYWLWVKCGGGGTGTTTATSTITSTSTIKISEKKMSAHLNVQRLVADSRGSFKGSGSVSPQSGDYQLGSTAVITARPNKDSKVVWSSGCSGSSNTCKVKMDSDKKVYYSFILKKDSNWFKNNCTLVVDPISREVSIQCSW